MHLTVDLDESLSPSKFWKEVSRQLRTIAKKLDVYGANRLMLVTIFVDDRATAEDVWTPVRPLSSAISTTASESPWTSPRARQPDSFEPPSPTTPSPLAVLLRRRSVRPKTKTPFLNLTMEGWTGTESPQIVVEYSTAGSVHQFCRARMTAQPTYTATQRARRHVECGAPAESGTPTAEQPVAEPPVSATAPPANDEQSAGEAPQWKIVQAEGAHVAKRCPVDDHHRVQGSGAYYGLSFSVDPRINPGIEDATFFRVRRPRAPPSAESAVSMQSNKWTQLLYFDARRGESEAGAYANVAFEHDDEGDELIVTDIRYTTDHAQMPLPTRPVSFKHARLYG